MINNRCVSNAFWFKQEVLLWRFILGFKYISKKRAFHFLKKLVYITNKATHIPNYICNSLKLIKYNYLWNVNLERHTCIDVKHDECVQKTNFTF